MKNQIPHYLGLTHKLLKSRHKKGAGVTIFLGYARSHNSLFVTVIFSKFDALCINALQKLRLFSEKYIKIRLDS